MYEEFSLTYDLLTQDVDYPNRSNYILSLFEKFDRTPTLLLDLACGTGGFSNCFAKKGISVIGVDISPDMLNVAQNNSKEKNLDVLYLCQDATELDLYGTVDGAVCCQDSLNHILSFEDLCKALSRVSLFLEKDRLFIFDLNTPYKHQEILGNNTFVLEEENLFCVWQNQYTKESNTVDIALDFFKETEEGLYERSSEIISERAYTEKEIALALERASLKIEGIFEELTLNSPQKETQRIFYVTRKV